MYLAHFPIVMLIYSFVYSGGQVTLSVSNLATYLGWIVLIMGLSYLLWLLFEKQTGKVRRLVANKLIKKVES